MAAQNGLSEDIVVNTFHLGQPGDGPRLSPALDVGRFNDFYNEVQPSGYSIASFLGYTLSRASNAHLMTFVDLDEPSPRVPYADSLWTLSAASSSGSLLPEEVAVALSWTGDPVSGVPMARRRGRTFLGPLNSFVVFNAGQGISRPWLTFRQTIKEAAEDLISAFTGDLVVYSKTSVPAAATPITGGWIDDAFDTIRSRGPSPTSKLFLV
jgi:hypothetical protein